MTKRTKAILSLSGVFLLGALCGALAVGAFVRGEVRSSHRLRDRGGFKEYFADKLELTTAQRDSLQEDLDWFYEQFAGLRTAAAGEYHELLDSLDRRLVSHLSPEQIERLRSAEVRLRRHMPRPGPRHDIMAPESLDEAPAPGTRSDSARSRPAQGARDAGTTPEPAATQLLDSASRDSAAVVAADPGPEMDRFGARLKERLKLSDAQLVSIREILGATRRQIRTDVRANRGYPRIQLEIAGRHLKTMDQRILEVLDESQRAAYGPVGEEIALRIRMQMIKGLQREKRRGVQPGGPEPRRGGR